MSSHAEKDYMADAAPAKATDSYTGRTIPMKVICPGMSRSGTGSMRQALETLGIGRTFHGLRLGERPKDLDVWIDLVDRKYPRSKRPQDAKPITSADFDLVIGDCGGVTDMPCAAFWRELMAAYPDAKVILVERDLDEWYRSFDQAVVQGMLSIKGQILANQWIARLIQYRNPEMLQSLFLSYFQARNRQELAANARRVYVEHNEAIRKACREQSRAFLDYKLGSGWQPLCDFLGVDVPKEVDFPRGNEAKVLLPFIHKAQRELIIRAVTKLLSRSTVIVAIIGSAVIAWKQPNISSWINR